MMRENAKQIVRYAIALVCLLPPALQARTLYVDAAHGNDANDGRTTATAKREIQQAVQVAAQSDVIEVAEGVYAPISTANKTLTIRSQKGASFTTIHGGNTNRCATLGTSSSHTNTVLIGFTLTAGSAQYGGGSYGGTLHNCVFRKNIAEQGGGSYYGVLNSCLYFQNAADFGGASYYGTLNGCTLSANAAATYAGGARSGMLNNCIVWDNTAPLSNNCYNTRATYTCTADPALQGTGNISQDPKFVDSSVYDYRLRTGSPCLSKPTKGLSVKTAMGVHQDEISGLTISTRIVGCGLISPPVAIVNTGQSATLTAEPMKRPFLRWETNGVTCSLAPTITLNNIQADTILTAVFEMRAVYVDASRPDDSGDGYTWATAKKTLQAGIDIACKYETVWVQSGTYAPIVTANKPITIKSLNGPNVTSIDARGADRCALLGFNTTQTNTALEGFTLTDGFARDGGGVQGGHLINCILSKNKADRDGGGAYRSVLDRCIISDNNAYLGGGVRGSILNNCLVAGNNAVYGGGVVSSTLANSTVTRNSAINVGGGVDSSTLYNTIVWGNAAQREGNNIYDCKGQYNCTDPQIAGEGNISSNPQFTDSGNNDYRLRVGSICVDRGNNNFAPGTLDLLGKPRIHNTKVDIGACEYQP